MVARVRRRHAFSAALIWLPAVASASVMGEGYSATSDRPASLASRAFTLMSTPVICHAAPVPDRVEFADRSMTFPVGQRLALEDLPNVAAFRDGRLAEAVPIWLSYWSRPRRAVELVRS